MGAGSRFKVQGSRFKVQGSRFKEMGGCRRGGECELVTLDSVKAFGFAAG
jgi:hypothetical protein